ncbi:MAG: EamA family transporter RarD [Pseudomonadota bacterium]
MDHDKRGKAGVWLATAAFAWWGLVPIYFKSVATVGALEILAHRVLWSVPVAALLVSLNRGWPQLRRDLANRRVVATLALSAVIVALNWLLFIHSVETGQVLQSSLGYFICPLLNVVMGVVFLGERPHRLQVAAVGLAALGTLNQVVEYGAVPWLALGMALSFSVYGLIRKQVAIESLGGLFLETAFLAPLALAWLVWLQHAGQLAFIHAGGGMSLLLISAGVVTALPLVWFAAGARRIPLYVLGLLQYIAPSLQFLLAVLVYDEPLSRARLVTFALVWSGVVLFVLAGLPAWRTARRIARQ